MNKRVISLLLALTMVFSLLPGTAIGAAAAEADGYTYRFYNPTMPDCWNPHTWTGSEASTLLSYLETPLVDMTVSDSEKGIYQWVYLAAESITDVTADHQEDLVTYGADSTTATSGFVYEIALNPDMKWQDGTAINADTYIYSMQQLLDPDMQNYRANNYCTGNSAIAGAYAYYHSNEEGYYVPYTDVYSSLDEAMAATDVLLDVWGFWNAKGYIDADGNECPQYVSLTDETVYSADGQGNDAFSGAALYRDYGSYFEPGTGYDSYVVVWQVNPNKGVTYDVVGLYKVDDYTIRYVTQSYVEWYYLYTSLTSNWIVHEELYESCKETGSYGTSLDTTMSYGPYMLESMDLNSQIVLTQNPNHYEYTQNSDGTLSSKTDFLVDGANVEQWQATKVVWSLMGYDSAKAAFLEGQLDSWEPSGDDLLAYANSERLYKAEETYTMRLFFNTDVEALQAMDAGETDYAQTNAIVLSNENFRKAFSLAIDRADWVTATSGYNPALGLMNDLYFYDVYNDPASSYRSSDEAMAAMCDLYGVSYTDDTLQAAYDSLTGYDLTQAKALMAQACDELVEAGLYTEGEDIYIQIGWTNGALTSEIWAQAAKLTAYLNAAAADSGFGTITLNPVGYSNRYNNVPGDQLPIGYGAWGGAAFYPFNMMQVYLNPNYVGTLHEGACWDPLTETLTLTLDGEAVTMTWAEWSQACTSGAYRSADFATKLTITSALESQYLAKYYCIPLASSTSCSLLSHKLDYYTGTYNIMYDFGGLRLMRFNYSDAEWADYIASGDLDYGATELPTTPETEATETEPTTEPTETEPAETEPDETEPDEPSGEIVDSGSCGENVTWTLADTGLLTVSGTGPMYDYEWGESPFYNCTGISSVVIENGVTTVGYASFACCNNLESFFVPASIVSLEYGAVYACHNLKNFEVDEANTTYSSDAFGVLFNKDKTVLIQAPGAITEAYVIPESATTIKNSAFENCTMLTGITIPSSVTTIGNNAFSSCFSLKSISIPDSVTSIGYYAFYLCTGLQAIEVAENNPNYSSDSFGVLFNKDKSELIQAPCTISGEYVIPDSVTSINDAAFYATNLTSIDIGDNVSSIDYVAFGECHSLTSITIPDSVTSIDNYAFFMCDNLASIVFEGDAPEFGSDIFFNVTATAYYPAGNATWTEDVMQQYGGTITWIAGGSAAAAFEGNSLSLNGDIGVNFYVSLTEELLADENLRMVFNVGDTAQEMALADAVTSEQEDGSVWYRFSCSLPAKSMADEVVAQLYGTDGAVGNSTTYSVAAYYDAICQQFSREDKPELFAMVEAMLNYGAAAQEYFGYNTDDPANAAVTAAVPEDIDASDYAAIVSDSDKLLDYAGMSLVLESNTALRVFFRAVNGADLSEYVFTVGGETVTPVQKDGLWYVELSGIAAKDLDTVCTVTAGDVTVQCSALTYVYNVLQKADSLDGKLVSLCKALFAYNQTADAYFAVQN